MVRFLAILCMSVLLYACSNKKVEQKAIETERQDHNESLAKPSFEIKQMSEDSLRIKYTNSGTVFITSEGKIYGHELSQDERNLVVNSRIHSGLDISMLYQLNEKGKFETRKPINISRMVWDSIARRDKLDPRNLINPRSVFIGWEEKSNKLLISAHGNLKGGLSIKDTLSLLIP